MNKLLETYKLTRIKQKEVENLHVSLMSKEIESVIKKLPHRKTQDQMASLVNSTKQLKKN